MRRGVKGDYFCLSFQETSGRYAKPNVVAMGKDEKICGCEAEVMLEWL